MNKKRDENVVCKTEEQLKQETLARAERQARLDAQKPPQSPLKRKWDNYWYHYKWHTAGICALAIAVFYFVQSVVFQVRPDISVVFASSSYVAQERIDALRAAIEGAIADFNGDGKVLAQLDFIYLTSAAPTGEGADATGAGINGAAGGGDDATDETAGARDGSPAPGLGLGMAADPQIEQASAMKLMAVTAAGSTPLYLVDDGMYEYLARMANPAEYDGDEPAPQAGGGELYSMFEPLDGMPGATGPLSDRLPISATSLADAPGCGELGGFTFALRPQGAGKAEALAYRNFCLDFLKSVANGQRRAARGE
jgi:hypothetical protein